MNPSDLIVLCALGLPIDQCRDLFQWYLKGEPELVMHPGIHWWVTNYEKAVVDFLAEEYRTRYRRY